MQTYLKRIEKKKAKKQIVGNLRSQGRLGYVTLCFAIWKPDKLLLRKRRSDYIVIIIRGFYLENLVIYLENVLWLPILQRIILAG